MRSGCTLLRLLVSFVLVKLAFQYCYHMKLVSFRTTQTPNYLFSMTLHDNQTLSSVTQVLKALPTPMWKLMLVQHHNGKVGKVADPPKIIYNGTYKVCEVWRYFKRIRVFNNVAHVVLSNSASNMSLDCPLAAGTYVIRNMYVPPDTGILKFIYYPDTTYTLYGTVYSQLPNKSLEEKCSYEINGTVLKTC